MSKNVWGRERKRTWASGGEFRRDGSCCLQAGMGTVGSGWDKGWHKQKISVPASKILLVWENHTNPINAQLKRAAAAKIPLQWFRFWEEDKERLWDDNNQGNMNGRAQQGVPSISCILTLPQTPLPALKTPVLHSGDESDPAALSVQTQLRESHSPKNNTLSPVLWCTRTSRIASPVWKCSWSSGNSGKNRQFPNLKKKAWDRC